MGQDAKINDKDPGRQEVLLAEYKAAQASAEHHDRLVWTTSSIVWGGSLAGMGIILKNPTTDLWGAISKILLCFLGIILILFVWDCQGEFRYARNQKYGRCKEIEKILGMKHHLGLEWKPGSQTDKYSIIMRLFLVAWGLVALSVLGNVF